MLRLNARTRLSPEEAIKKAIDFFHGEQGMEVKEQSPTGAYFEGSGGGVDVTACAQEKGASVELVSREWDYQVREFARKIK